MKVYIEETPIRDLLILKHELFQDDRGFFMEVYRRDVFQEVGLPDAFVQMNHSRSARGVARGLHFQWDPPMGKLMRVTAGAAYLVAVDIRKNSPTLGRWFGAEVTAESKQQIWAPAGFARGFYVLSEYAEIQYLCTGTYDAAGESGILWNDPTIGIEWPAGEPILSAKDRDAQTFADWLRTPESNNFIYR
jgi:dTDP-4-dehydrorhamnose 3,5-epimerase